jgi:hypothetical protein
MMGMFTAQAVNPPPGMVPKSRWLAIRAGHKCFTFPHKSAETRVDEVGLRLHSGISFDGFDGLIDQGKCVVGRVDFIPGQCERNAKYGIKRRWRRLCSQPVPQRFGTT